MVETTASSPGRERTRPGCEPFEEPLWRKALVALVRFVAARWKDGVDSAGVLGKLLATLGRFVATHWVGTAGGGSAVLFVALGVWTFELTGEVGRGANCPEKSLSWYSQPDEACRAQLRRLIAATPAGAPRTCAPVGANNDVLCALAEPGRPRLLVWVDNFFADLYTLFFIACAVVSYRRLNRHALRPALAGTILLSASVVAALAGALLDHAENFWLLAHFGQLGEAVEVGIADAALLSIWKFRLAAANALIAALWLAVARYRTWRPHALLHRWPRWLWDPPSRHFFDSRRVEIDPANAAHAYPLLAGDLIGLAGAPRGSTLYCRPEGKQLRVSIRSARLELPLNLRVRYAVEPRRVAAVRIDLPVTDRQGHADGLTERILLSCCRSAWRLHVDRLELDASGGGWRGWALALAMGWDAALADDQRARLPPGLRHLLTVQSLMRYSDGRIWCRANNFRPLLHFDLAPGSVALEQLQEYASAHGLRLAP